MNKNQKTFGECLTKLIEIFKLKSSVLAKGISIPYENREKKHAVAWLRSSVANVQVTLV